MKYRLSKTITAIGSLALAGSLYASPITTWQVDVNTRFDTTSIVPTSGVTVHDDKWLSWGDPAVTGGDQSALKITDSPNTSYVNTNGPAVANVSVTHYNQPIYAPSLESVNILSTLTLTPFVPPGAPAVTGATITFEVLFEETPNNDDPCADGGANGSGVNINGCADIFVIDKDALNFEFTYNDLDDPGYERTYYISFFELTSGLNPLPAEACGAAGATAPCLGFRTPEEANTTFQFASLITTEPVRVPEPALLVLMGSALSLFGLVRRRKA